MRGLREDVAVEAPKLSMRDTRSTRAVASRERGRRWVTVAMLGLVAVGFVVANRALHRMYLSRAFGFHDLGLINDIIASLPHHGRVFRVFDYDINHLSLHFTPSLLVWTPLYWMFSSQFLLPALNAAALFGALAVAGLTLRRVFGKDTGAGELAAAYAFIAVALWTNTFFWNALTAAHYEEFYTFYAVCLLHLLIVQARLVWVVAFYLLCLGSRQDAGFFLAFQLGTLFLLPRGVMPDWRALGGRLWPMMALGPIYTAFIAKVIFPWYGTDQTWHAKRLWGHLGNSFEEIAWTLITHPARLWDEVVHSAAGAFNQSFFYVQALHPAAAVLNNIPGILFYTTSTPERKYLYYYNAALLLPGMLLSVVVGLAILRRMLARVPASRGLPSGAAFLVVMLLVCVYAASATPAGLAYSTTAQIRPGRFPETRARQALMAEVLASCRDATTAATDFNSVVFLPNRVGKYLPSHYRQADVVFTFPGNDVLYGDLARFREAVGQDPDFRLVRQEGEHAVFAKRSVVCRE
jgi:hypothetical protein